VNIKVHSKLLILAGLVMHLEAMIEKVWTYAFGGQDRVYMEVVIERVWRCAWRPLLCELEGHD